MNSIVTQIRLMLLVPQNTIESDAGTVVIENIFGETDNDNKAIREAKYVNNIIPTLDKKHNTAKTVPILPTIERLQECQK